MKNGRILEYTFSEVAEHGIKHANVDNIAAKLHMSKKTIYDLFENKEKLVLESLKYKIGKIIEGFSGSSKEGTNILAPMISNAVNLFRLVNSVTPLFMQEMHSYPLISSYVEQVKQELLVAGKRRFEEGIDEGVLRRDADFGIVGRLLESQIMTMYGKVGEKYTPEQICFNSLMIILRGVCTDKGIGMLDGMANGGFENEIIR